MVSIDNVQDIQPRVRYTATAAQVAFTYPFPIFQDSDIVVDVNGTVLTLTTNYTVTGEGDDNGGTVTLVTASTAGDIVTLYRDIGVERDTDFQQNGPWASVSFNDELDKITLILQQLEDRIGRAISFPLTAAITNAQTTLSPLTNFLGKFIRITDAGLLEAAVALDNVVTLTAEVIGSLIHPQTAAELAGAVTPTAFVWPAGDLRRYGAVLDGVTDDSAAWDDADLQSDAGGQPIFLASTLNGMAIASGVSTRIGTSVEFESGAFLLYTGSAEEAGLTLGTVVANTILRTFNRIQITRDTLSDWTDEDNIGVRCLNLADCWVDIRRASKFTIGLQVEGNDWGNAYNKYYLDLISENKVQVKLLSAETVRDLGFCNENNYFGGRLTQFSNANDALDTWGVVTDSTRVIKSDPNSNRFWGTCFELNNSGRAGVCRAILINYGLYNRFFHVRDETNDQPFMEVKNDSSTNIVTTTNSIVSSVQNDGLYSDNYVTPERFHAQNTFVQQWQSPNLPRTSNEYDGSDQVYIPGCSQRLSGAGQQHMALDLITVTDDWLDIPSTRGVGVMLDTTVLKRFIFRHDSETGNGPRVIVMPYDTNGVQLVMVDTFVDGDVNVGTDRITVTTHPFTNKDRIFLSTSGVLPVGLAAGINYFVKSIDANTIELYSDVDLVNILDITAAAGGGTHTIAIHSHVDGISAIGLSFDTDFGGAYLTSQTDSDVFFRVSDVVQFVWVGAFGATAGPCRIRSFGLTSIDQGSLSVFQGFLDLNSDPFPNDYVNYATADPANAAAGPNYPAGKQLKTFNVASGGVPGIVCVAQGLGGTAAWENEGVLS